MEHQVVVVTGGGRGIGQAVCRRFAREGAQVVAAARTDRELHETQQLVEQEGGRCMTVQTDVTSTDRLRFLIDGVARRLGRIDVLVNNAGMVVRASAADLPLTDFETMLRVNVAAVFHTCKLVWPIMTTQGGGVIVNISSMAAKDPFPGLGTYGASKAWVNAFTHSLSAEGRAANIRVFSIAPGAVWTEMLRSSFPDFPKKDALDPMDVAEMALSLCTPNMAKASGQTFCLTRT